MEIGIELALGLAVVAGLLLIVVVFRLLNRPQAVSQSQRIATQSPKASASKTSTHTSDRPDTEHGSAPDAAHRESSEQSMPLNGLNHVNRRETIGHIQTNSSVVTVDGHGGVDTMQAIQQPLDSASPLASTVDSAALQDLRHREAEIETRQAELHQQSHDISERSHLLSERERGIHDSELRLQSLEAELTQRASQLDVRQAQIQATLESHAGLTAEEARELVMSQAEREARLEAAVLAREIEQAATSEAEARARRTIVTAMQRLASEQTAESTVTTVILASDDMKGRVIGRDGRNIRSFEQVTGVNVVIDETPGVVALSSFDPLRREIARATMEELVADGRIHPARIEQVYARVVSTMDERIHRLAEDALVEVGITDIHPDLYSYIGALHFRTSYGQNVLRHSVESAHIAGLMASELGLDPTLSVRASFLHDLGKAVTHESDESHAIAGAELARQHGESPEVVHAIEAHHNEVAPETVEAVMVQAADAVSGSRPGARREALGSFVERMHQLEDIASSYEGVERVLAMQAGHELRVMVAPESASDTQAQAIARDIAHQIQRDMTYPGNIKVTVVRETRFTETAH